MKIVEDWGFKSNRGCDPLFMYNLYQRRDMSMRVTTVACSPETRDRIKRYRDEHDHENMDRALSAMLAEVTAES